MTKDEIHDRCIELLEECESDAVQRSNLTEWERNFLDNNFQRREDDLPFRSDKVMGILQRIVDKAYGKSSAGYADNSRR